MGAGADSQLPIWWLPASAKARGLAQRVSTCVAGADLGAGVVRVSVAFKLSFIGSCCFVECDACTGSTGLKG